MKCMIVVLVLILGGCSASEQPELQRKPPELISMASLPPFRSTSFQQTMKLNFMIHVAEDGSVEEARLVGTSGDQTWDSLALQSVRQWRFAVARYQGEPTNLWIRQEVTVSFREPTRLPLGELVVKTSERADSLYSLLISGAPFDSLARQFSTSESRTRGGALEMVDINLYPPHVRNELEHLREGEITHPLRLGDTYVIFKRLRANEQAGPF